MPMSPEQRKAAGERLAAARAAKATKKEKAEAAQNNVSQLPDKTATTPAPSPDTVGQDDLAELRAHVAELESFIHSLSAAPQLNTAQMAGNRLIGVTDKYILDPNYYPDPRPRLSHEPRLQRFAFAQNYELEWQIETTQYETKAGLNFQEPRFTLALNGIVFDDLTGNPTNGRYTITRLTFHEDPQAAIVIARENGLGVDQSNEREFLNEMRYLRARDWLLEVFYPPKSDPSKKKTEKVIGNKLVTYWEMSTDASDTTPLTQLLKG